jgi:hypothetical protein
MAAVQTAMLAKLPYQKLRNTIVACPTMAARLDRAHAAMRSLPETVQP